MARRRSARRRRDAWTGAFFILLAALGWGLLGPVARVAFEEGMAPLEVAFWRAALGGVLFGIHAAVAGGTFPAKRDLPGFVAFALVGGAIFFASYQLAVEAGGAALAAVLLYTAPAWVVAAGVLWLGETLSAAKIFAVLMTMGGVILIASGSADARYTAAAIMWGLLAGISYASYYVFGKMYFGRYSSASVYAFVFPVAAVVLAPFLTFGPKSGTAVIAVLVIGVVSTYLTYLVYAAGLRRLEASRASIIATTEPVIAGILAYAWWGERFGTAGYVGAALILGAVLWVVLLGGRRHTNRKQRVRSRQPVANA